MSVASEVNRIQAARNLIRSTLVAWGVAQSGDDLDALADALAALQNRGAVDVTLDEGQTYTVPAGYHNGSGTVENIVKSGRMEPFYYDYNSGYIQNGTWHYENPTQTYCDIYAVEAGKSYFFSLGGTVGTRFRSMFTTEDVTQTTGTVVGTTIKNINNPQPFASADFTAPEDGFILIAKDNIGASGLGSYLYCRTDKWL